MFTYLGLFSLRAGSVDWLELLSSLPVVASLWKFPLVVECCHNDGDEKEDGQTDGQDDVGDQTTLRFTHGTFVGASSKEAEEMNALFGTNSSRRQAENLLRFLSKMLTGNYSLVR